MYDVDYLDPKSFLYTYVFFPRGLNFHVEETCYENIMGEITISQFSSWVHNNLKGVNLNGLVFSPFIV